MVKANVRIIHYCVIVATRVANRPHSTRKDESVSFLFVNLAGRLLGALVVVWVSPRRMRPSLT